MPSRSMGLSEARRLLPQIVRDVARDGGRVDITRRGEPVASIVRASDLEPGRRSLSLTGARALRVEFNVPPGTLVSVIRDLRARIGRARESSGAVASNGKRRSKRGRARRVR